MYLNILLLFIVSYLIRKTLVKTTEKRIQEVKIKAEAFFSSNYQCKSQSLRERRQNGRSSREKYFEDAKYPKIIRAGK